MLGSLMILASGRVANAPSSLRASGTRCASVRKSGKAANIRPANEISLVLNVMPDEAQKRLIIGNSEWVAK